MARDFHARGWMPGSAGNLSARTAADADHLWITASGRAKGRLAASDFVCVAIQDGAVLKRHAESDKPSAETSIHCALYRLFPHTTACLHVHSMAACLATAGLQAGTAGLALPPLEILKGLGIWEESPRVDLPLFENAGQVTAIASAIQQRFSTQPPALAALLVRDHGVTVWGDSLQQAYNHLECIEFVLDFSTRGDKRYTTP